MLHKGFYLVGIENEIVVDYDGSHSDKSGVLRALALIESLYLRKPKATYHIVEVDEDVSIDKSSASYLSTLNMIIRNNPDSLQPVELK